MQSELVTPLRTIPSYWTLYDAVCSSGVSINVRWLQTLFRLSHQLPADAWKRKCPNTWQVLASAFFFIFLLLLVYWVPGSCAPSVFPIATFCRAAKQYIQCGFGLKDWMKIIHDKVFGIEDGSGKKHWEWIFNGIWTRNKVGDRKNRFVVAFDWLDCQVEKVTKRA